MFGSGTKLSMDQIVLYLTIFSRLVFGSDQLVQDSIVQIRGIFHSDVVPYRSGKMTERFYPGRMDRVSFTARDLFRLLHLLSRTTPSLFLLLTHLLSSTSCSLISSPLPQLGIAGGEQEQPLVREEFSLPSPVLPFIPFIFLASFPR
jgi:hypothetical protein